MYEDLKIDLLVGKILNKIESNGSEMIFYCSDGEEYMLYHEQDCCESVEIEDIIGDIEDLIGSPIIRATEDTGGDNPEGITKEYQEDSFTWTFYNIATAKGHVTIRWYGESNGYYSESVNFCKL